jgi:hypothetical protein
VVKLTTAPADIRLSIRLFINLVSLTLTKRLLEIGKRTCSISRHTTPLTGIYPCIPKANVRIFPSILIHIAFPFTSRRTRIHATRLS